MNPEIEALSKKIDEVYKSVEKTRKYFLIVLWVTIIAVILPLIGLVIAIPSFIASYTTALSSF
jgi:hypothetical protein